MSSSSDGVFGLDTARIVVPVGATVAVLLDASINPGANSVMLKYFSGGTLEIIGVTGAPGATYTPLQLANFSGTQYIVGTSEVLSIDGPTRCYLSSTGATTVVMAMRGKTQGT